MILGVRHGERGDKSPSKEEQKNVELYFDPHLTLYGQKQAQITGQEIQKRIDEYQIYLQSLGKPCKKLTPVILTSPFLRTIQTAYNIAVNLKDFYQKTIFVDFNLCELLWDQEEFDKDPIPGLFSNNHKNLEDYKRYGLDFNSTNIKLEKSIFMDKELNFPQYPEDIKLCPERVAKWLKKIPELFFKNFDSNEYVLIWVSHQYIIGTAMWYYLNTDKNGFNWSEIQLCGIVEVRYQDPLNNYEFKVLSKGDNNHLNEKI